MQPRVDTNLGIQGEPDHWVHSACILCSNGCGLDNIVQVHTSDVDYKGYTHHASEDDPQYEIKSDKTDHIAAHKGTALREFGK